MKEFISYNEMKRILFPTDIQSETFIMPDESMYDDFMDADGNESDILAEGITETEGTEKDIRSINGMDILNVDLDRKESDCNRKHDCLEDKVNCIEGLKRQKEHDDEQDIENINDHMPVYPLENLYKDINIEEKALLDGRNSRNYLISVNYAKVRILHAASGFQRLNISIGSRRMAERLPFGVVSNYVNIIDGYRTVSVSDTETGLLIMYDVLPFVTGSKVTIVVFNTAAGMELSVVPDNMCKNKLMDKSCFRVANFTFDDGPFDLLFSNMSGIFTDIRTKEVTSFKQAADGDYRFYVVDALYNLIPYNHPINHMLGSKEEDRTDVAVIKSPEYILDICVKFRKNITYTIYIIGGFYPEVPIQEVIVENE